MAFKIDFIFKGGFGAISTFNPLFTSEPDHSDWRACIFSGCSFRHPGKGSTYALGRLHV